MNTSPGNQDDDAVAQLLREAGAREVPAPAAMNQVRETLYAEWQSVVARRRRRAFLGYGMAAAAVAALAIGIGVQFVSLSRPIATVARIDGTLEIGRDDEAAWRAAVTDATVRSGDVLRTGADTRAALRVGEGISLRIDRRSLVRFVRVDRIELSSGAIYVDVEPQATGESSQPLSIDTRYGSVHHLGTQYEVRALRDAVEISVREGRVEVVAADRKHEGAAGDLLSVSDAGVSTAQVSPQDPRWQWAAGIAPAFAIDRQPLSRFLEWAARETGRQLEYASPQVRAQADQLILRGSMGELPPEQALAAVLATTPFRQAPDVPVLRIEL